MSKMRAASEVRGRLNRRFWRVARGSQVALFDPEVLQTLIERHETVTPRFIALAESYRSFGFRTERAAEYSKHDCLRRVSTMQYCIERVFYIISPDQNIPPQRDTLMEATVCIQ